MSHYVIGDIQGCYAEFQQLMEMIAFAPGPDRLWLVGDLVNRGPDSLSVLRTVKSFGAAATTVLGNHDLHLLIVAAGHRKPHRHDTLAAILEAPDREELLDWLRRRPLVVREGELLMVHAGLLPGWTPADAVGLSREVESVLASSACDAFLAALYGDEPARWDPGLAGHDRLRVIVNAFTRLRFCSPDGTLEFGEKRGPAYAPPGFAPWFAHPTRRSAGARIFCGHWSTLDLMFAPNVMMLDSGCLWGGTLTAVRLDDARVFQVPSRAAISPKPLE
jgi:bis(5'-nucleosyl)-tetraphosphatase (symmetrical)